MGPALSQGFWMLSKEAWRMPYQSLRILSGLGQMPGAGKQHTLQLLEECECNWGRDLFCRSRQESEDRTWCLEGSLLLGVKCQGSPEATVHASEEGKQVFSRSPASGRCLQRGRKAGCECHHWESLGCGLGSQPDILQWLLHAGKHPGLNFAACPACRWTVCKGDL